MDGAPGIRTIIARTRPQGAVTRSPRACRQPGGNLPSTEADLRHRCRQPTNAQKPPRLINPT